MRKNAIVWMATMILTVGICACGRQKAELKLETDVQVPEYEDDRELVITAKYEKNDGMVSLLDISDYQNCGFSFLLAGGNLLYDYNATVGGETEKFAESELYSVMEIAESLDFSVVADAKELRRMVDSEDEEPNEEQRAFLAGMLADLSCYSAFHGISLQKSGEYRSTEETDMIKTYANALRDNLFYYDCFCPTVYPTERKTETWLEEIIQAAQYRKENVCEQGMMVQSDGTEAELRFQVNMALAHGFTQITYETYRPMETKEDIRIYNNMKKLNQELRELDHVYMHFSWQDTLQVRSKAKKFATVKRVKCENDIVLTHMKDEEERDGYWVLNPPDTAQNEIQMVFEKAVKALIYQNGEETVVSLKNETYTVTLEAGESVFVIPIS